MELLDPVFELNPLNDLGQTVPDVEHGAMRDLVRVANQAHQHLQIFLLRHGRHYPGKKSWAKAYRRWLTMNRFDHSARQIVFQDYIHAVTDAEAQMAVLRTLEHHPEYLNRWDSLSAGFVIHQMWKRIMGKSLSLDIRERVVALVNEGLSRRLRIDELSAPWVLDGPMNRAAFDAYIETQPAPTLQPGDVVIADNLSSHKTVRAQHILKAQGSWMLFLPPYSPDLNPIEMAYSKLKAQLRRLKARTFDTLFQSVAQTCKLLPPQECQNFFKAAGYVAD